MIPTYPNHFHWPQEDRRTVEGTRHAPFSSVFSGSIAVWPTLFPAAGEQERYDRSCDESRGSDLLQIPCRDRHKPAEVLSQVQEVSFQWSHLPATASESQAEDWNLHGMAWNCLKWGLKCHQMPLEQLQCPGMGDTIVQSSEASQAPENPENPVTWKSQWLTICKCLKAHKKQSTVGSWSSENGVKSSCDSRKILCN